jgi:hypothetical protein
MMSYDFYGAVYDLAAVSIFASSFLQSWVLIPAETLEVLKVRGHEGTMDTAVPLGPQITKGNTQTHKK